MNHPGQCHLSVPSRGLTSFPRHRVHSGVKTQSTPSTLLWPRFLEALEQRHKAQVCVEDISDILEEHAERHFHPYVIYCSNELYQQRALQRLT